ncbi:TPA: conjugal transfer protein TraD [Legionella anisa]
MITINQIKRQQQVIARCEKSLALEKLKKRRADTRRKIELGGLVIKSGMDDFNKSVILGALDYSLRLLREDKSYNNLFESIGNSLFLNM